MRPSYFALFIHRNSFHLTVWNISDDNCSCYHPLWASGAVKCSEFGFEANKRVCSEELLRCRPREFVHTVLSDLDW